MKPRALRENVNPIQDNKIHTTTVRLPGDLYNQVKTVLEEGAFDSFNELIVAGVQNLLKMLRERDVDLQFARMAEDENYQKVAINLYSLFENPAPEAHARTAGQSVTANKDAWSEDLNRGPLVSNPRPSIKAYG